MKNTHQIKGGLNPPKVEEDQNQATKQFNNLLLLESKQDEILNRFRAKLEDIDKDIHKLISELYIPETNNKIN
ncbi:MAG: hypothetical protein Q8L90_08370 [Bacteroidota bacterium]|nr:hypothetical protein [Bacteroidota bacterium]